MAKQFTRRDVLRAGIAGGAALAAPSLAIDELVQRALAVAPSGAGRLEDIEHVVIFIQENRAFDHYFGTYKGVIGFGDPNAIPGVFAQPGYPVAGFGGQLSPFHLDTYNNGDCTNDPSHDWGPQHRSWHGGRMDAWVSEHIKTNQLADGSLTMGYYTRRDLPFYHALADGFTICDRYHCSVIGPTDPNRLYSLSATLDPDGTRGGPILATSVTRLNRLGKLRWTTMPEQLRERGVSWKVYATPDANLLDNVLPFFAQYLADPGLLIPATTPTFPGTLELDVANGTLPQVSWVLANNVQAEHPPAPVTAGEAAAASLVGTLTSNPDVWAKTALFITYDENGGFFDHVPPPVAPPGTPGEYLTVKPLPDANNSYSGDAQSIAGPIGLGFRVPMLVVSPFARGGFVSSDVFDHTSLLRFLETRFGAEVPNLTSWRRSVTGDLTSAFNFAAPDVSIPALPPALLLDPRALTSSACVGDVPGLITENSNGTLDKVPIDTRYHYPVPLPNTVPAQEPGSPRRPSGLVGATAAIGGGPALNIRISHVPRKRGHAGFRAVVEVGGSGQVKFVHVRVNGRLIFRTSRRRSGVFIHAARLRAGDNRLTAVVRDTAGHQATAVAHFKHA
jgi:phospholipase C